ncbi:hypothetical protein IWX64_003318 [Arthrobacter sp. CAN_A212]|uniref:DUF4383 domain-containing protein n=1 Tax=unclassified Arthrobacter TaxID=235627 RepID=UPI0018C9FDAC|nr:DUF4383 domain-containing protein [Arthrobacter sp. CAN_C5]MBP2216690.1 hypothetical protein [Arthrobacter sp. CAN_C5]
MTASHQPVRQDREKTTMQKAAMAVGIVFVLFGVLGFVPGVTTEFDQMDMAGHESEALLLGLFQVSILHNIVHLLYGVAGLVLARTYANAKNYLLIGGVLYLVLWIYGLVIDLNSDANFVPFNDADNWLHLFLGVGMIALALILSRKRDHATTNRV